MLADDLS